MATSTSTTSMPDWAQPYAEGYLGRAQQVADTPYQGYSGPTTAGFTPWQQQGLQAQATRATQGSETMNGANATLQGMYGAKAPGATVNPYAGAGNPYLTSQIDQAQGDVVRNWNQVQMPGFDRAMSASGSFGNANVQGMASQGASDLQRNLGDISNNMRFKDYSTQQTLGEQWATRNDNQYNNHQQQLLSALGMAPSFASQDYTDISKLNDAGAAYQAQSQREIDGNVRQFLDQRGYPQQQLDVMGGALSKSLGQQTTNTAPDPSTASQLLGGGLAGASLYNMLFKP